MKCGKKRLDKIKAMLVVAEALNSSASHRMEKRFYFCQRCNAYHVTKTDKLP